MAIRLGPGGCQGNVASIIAQAAGGPARAPREWLLSWDHAPKLSDCFRPVQAIMATKMRVGFGSRAADYAAAEIMVCIPQMSICFAIARASSTSIPR